MKRNLHVTPHEDGWAIKREGEDSVESTHRTSSDALAAAEEIAIEEQVNVVVHREDGTFRSVRNFSNEDRDGAVLSNVSTQDIFSVGSRVSWGALLAGAVVALVVYIALSVLGVAIGVSVSPSVESSKLAWGTVIWAGISMLSSLFIGGFVTSKTTVGEKKEESLIYGLLIWGVMFVLLTVLSGIGMDFGFGRVIALQSTDSGVAIQAVSNTDVAENLEDDQLVEVRSPSEADAGETRSLSSVVVAWCAFFILVGSMMTSILGALVGAGPELVLRRIRGNRTAVVRKPS